MTARTQWRRFGVLVVAGALVAGLAAGSAAASPAVASLAVASPAVASLAVVSPAAASSRTAASSGAAAQGEGFTPGGCAELGVDPAVLGERATVECGRLAVPERRDVAGSPLIRLGVVVARSTAPNRLPDPLFMAQGGPGGATIDTYLTDPDLVISGPLAAGRDVVLFDQRGTGVSQPGLFCSETDDLTVRTAALDLPPAEETRLSVEALAGCRTRLLAAGIDLAGYTTVENAADVEALRTALGYEKINFYGVSYGTALGFEVLRRHSAGLRSVILDGVVPPQENFVESTGTNLDASMTALFADCAADPRCAAAYPDLEATFTAQVEQLNRQPARVPMTDTDSGITYQVPMNGEDLQVLLFQLLYATQLLGSLPTLIHDVRDDRFDTLGRIAGLFLFDRSVATGMYYSVQCAEESDVDPAAVGAPGLRPAAARFNAEGVRNFVAACGAWPQPSLSPAIDVPVTSDVPALLLSGRFDPVTPAGNAADAAATLPGARSYTFPNTGHGAFGSEPCAAAIVGSFLADPAARPADGCLAGLGAPAFLTPDDVVRLPAVLRLANLEGRSLAELATFGGAFLVLLTGLLVLPLAWLIRRARGIRRPGPASRLARAVPWLVLLDALAIFAFVVGLVGVFLATYSRDEAILLLGLPRSAAWILGFPIGAMVLGVLMVLGVVLGWRGGGWRVWRRIYLGLLALAAASCAVLLAAWAVG